MNAYESLSHTKWECKYPVVFIPKYRRKALYGPLRQHMGPVFRELARQKECEGVEGHLMPDHVHMLLSIPPKYAVSAVMGFIKGKSAIHIARVYAGKRRNFAHPAEAGAAKRRVKRPDFRANLERLGYSEKVGARMLDKFHDSLS